METILLSILLPLIITGMSFISYKHPEIAFKILAIIAISSTIIFFLLFFNLDGKTKAYNESVSATYLKIYKYQQLNIDSIKVTLNNIDSIQNIENLKNETRHNEDAVKDSIRNKINIISTKNDSIKSKVINYYAFTILAIVVFFFLANTFNNLWQKKSEEHNNKTDQTAE